MGDIPTKQTNDVNTTTNTLHEMNYHIAHVLSFCKGYNILIYQFNIPSNTYIYIIIVIKQVDVLPSKNQVLCKLIYCIKYYY